MLQWQPLMQWQTAVTVKTHTDGWLTHSLTLTLILSLQPGKEPSSANRNRLSAYTDCQAAAFYY
jgi:hypothetical protein